MSPVRPERCWPLVVGVFRGPACLVVGVWVGRNCRTVVAVGVGEGSIRPGVVIVAEFRGSDEAQARADVTQRVASECGIVPSNVILVRPGALPRTSSGKLRRLEVKGSINDNM